MLIHRENALKRQSTYITLKKTILISNLIKIYTPGRTKLQRFSLGCMPPS